jgi:hypothetical protein
MSLESKSSVSSKDVRRAAAEGMARLDAAHSGRWLALATVLVLLSGCSTSAPRPTADTEDVDPVVAPSKAGGVAVRTYHTRQTRGAEAEAKAIGYQESQGTVLKLRRAWIEPAAASPGKVISFEVEYALLGSAKELTVSEQWEILKDGKTLVATLPHTERRGPGGWRAWGSIGLPRDAKPGAYVIRSSVRTAKLVDSQDTRFAILGTQTKTREARNTAAMASASRDLMQVQGRLKELGHDPGPVDGRFGLQTRTALKSFQSDYGLAATGAIDAETRAALGLGKKATP